MTSKRQMTSKPQINSQPQLNSRRRRSLILLLGSTLAIFAVLLAQQPASPSSPLAKFLPAGALLVLEAQNLSQLTTDWAASPEKTLWLDSDNYRSFSRSKLFLRLAKVYDEFTKAAGFAPDLRFLRTIAGDESALAIYDIGDLQFLYITQIPSARAMRSVLWQTRPDFEPRKAGGQTYYLRADPKTHRTVAFATSGDYLLLATADSLLATALTLASGPSDPAASPSVLAVNPSVLAVNSEPWYADLVSARPGRGELRLLMNMAPLTATPHFRSYWIQRNVTELKQYRAGVADLFRSPKAWREERLFLRRPDAPAPPAPAPPADQQPDSEQTSGIAQLIQLVPGDAGFYQAWARPTAADALNRLRAKLLAPRTAPVPRRTAAPTVATGPGRVGSEQALETRIDQAPPKFSSGVFSPGPLREWLATHPLEGMLQVESTRRAPGGIFVTSQTALVLAGSTDWDAAAARSALHRATAGLWTTANLGAQWTEATRNNVTFHQLDGLTPLAVAVKGRHILIANSPELLASLARRLDASQPAASPANPAIYQAGFRHSREQENYRRLMSHLDYPQIGRYQAVRNQGNAKREPAFFSESIASLSQVLSRFDSATVSVEDTGPSVTETIIYTRRP